MNKFSMIDINLNDESYKISDITDLFDEYLGGTGVGNKILLDSFQQDQDPLSEEAPIIFSIGPFSAVYPVATKTVALFKSPLTGNLGESHAGGRLAMSMYGAGYHVIKITGKTKYLSYLVVTDSGIKIKRANSLNGESALATERILRDKISSQFKKSIVRIGPAGERLSPIACATVDSSRHFGRLGLGAVMGSKNLKAIVVTGGKYWKLEEKQRYNKFYKKIYDLVVESSLMQKYHDLGTPINVLKLNAINGLPTRNFSQGFFENAKNVSGENFAESCLTQQISCAHCQIGCIHLGTVREAFKIEDHMYKTFKVSYDHETIFSMGTNLSIEDPETILKLLIFIEKQGWDAMSIGVTLSWATEAFQKGIIGEKETAGLVFNFGDGKLYETIMQRIADNHNRFYSDLEMGSKYCSEKYGGKEFAIQFGANEAPGYMTGLHAFLGYATGIRHSHLDSAGYSFDQENLAKPQPDEILTKKMFDESIWRITLNSLVLCLFARNIYKKDIILEGLEVLGINGWDGDRLETAARKILKDKYLYKEKCGFKLEDIELPDKLTEVYTSTGKLKKERFRTEIARVKELIGKL